MARQSWRMVGVNMTDDDKARLDALSHLWGTSNAATVRRLIQQATVGLLPDERDGHTCPPQQFDRYGCSNPMAVQGACVACWPTTPNPEEKHQGEMRRITALGSVEEHLPWWVHTHRVRQERDQADRQAVVDNEMRADRLQDEALTWDIENERMPAHLRQCTALTKKGARCTKKPQAGTYTTCAAHTSQV